MIKGKRGTFRRAMRQDWGAIIDMVEQDASIYEEVFAVYKDDRSIWHLDHIPTGYRICTASRKKDCVVRVEALLAIPIDWTLDSEDAIYKDMRSDPDDIDLYVVAKCLLAD